MPRRAREKSSTGVYHVMVRGINRQDVFNDEEDKQKFLSNLKKYKEICRYDLYGYCLMSNHIHLLIKEGIEPIDRVMKRIGASYVYWYNMKYGRFGHLFQGRFKSENVEDDVYLKVVLRYIHQNPLKAGIVQDLADYTWSSYNEYIKQEGIVTDIAFILKIFDSDFQRAAAIFKDFMEEENKDRCLDDELRKKQFISDEDARAIIKKMTGSPNPQVLQTISIKERDEIIRKLKEKHLSVRQLARLTGLGKRVVEKA